MNKELSLRELQLKSLEILKSVHSFCKENHIQYTLAYGTLLGAVRHRGFIPWDNDIDIAMPRPEYNRFLSEYISSQYDLLYCDKENTNHCLVAYARVVDRKTTYATNYDWCNSEVGVWIDIFPLDAVSDDYSSFERSYFSMQNEWCTLNKERINNISLKDITGLRCKLSALKRKVMTCFGFRGTQKCLSFISRNREVRWNDTSHWSQLSIPEDGTREYYDISLLRSYVLLDFEDTQFYALEGYVDYLTKLYGNYLQLPPENERVGHMSRIKFYWK